MSKIQHLFKSKVSGTGKRKYGKLSLQQKIEIIRAAEVGFSQRALASQYNCGKTQVHLLVTQKAMWLDKWERSLNGKVMDDSHYYPDQAKPYSDINDLVFDFYAKLSSTGIPVTGSMLQERAFQVSKELHQMDFVADQEWLEIFVSQYEVMLSENDDSGLMLLKSIGSRIKDESFIQSFEPSDIYNLGEVKLAYKFVPSSNNCMQPSSTKDYLTVSLCFNAIGGKEGELVVYDSSQHGEISTDLHTQCVSNWKGMMTQRLYEKRLMQLNADMASQNRHILLLVDESKYSGSLECAMSNIKVKPTSVCLQSHPLLCGIGHMFKFLYCRRLLRMLLSHMTTEEIVVELAEKLTLNKAVRLIQSAWDDLQPRTIQNGFFEAGLKHLKNDNADENQLSDSDEALIQEIKSLIGMVHQQDISEELSDEVFRHLIEENIGSNSTSDCSDSEEETQPQSLSKNSHINSHGDILSDSAQTSIGISQPDNGNISDVNPLVNDALASITKLDSVAGVICNKAQLQKARLLLNELEDLFEDVIADHKFKNLSEQPQ